MYFLYTKEESLTKSETVLGQAKVYMLIILAMQRDHVDVIFYRYMIIEGIRLCKLAILIEQEEQTTLYQFIYHKAA